MLCPYLHVNSAVEVPPGDYDVLHVTEKHPCRILMQASVKIVAVFVCWRISIKFRKKREVSEENITLPGLYVFDLSNLSFMLSEKLDWLGHIHFTMLLSK